ncbi:hypothetical protein F4561_005269 [Lipingzhangella halophila]|uniref:Uncharacterized protein n=1 Tax=Lipingzhangella halophila TaxID=1783352 RepID=A0A7W7RM16_9ACTN|nr:hypothetical protein [Lipingzhangella halophila]MBB4934449.1 hypothetical protein [Lipingzhangella halophila]
MTTAQTTDGLNSPHPVVSAKPPRWAVAAAYAVPLCLLPSSVWRTQLVATTGVADGWYMLVLTVAEMSLGLLTLGLVHSWGELLPRWVPLLGGRRIPVRAAVLPATIGAVAVTVLSVTMAAQELGLLWEDPQTLEQARALSSFNVPADTDFSGPADWVAWLYAPSLAWGPLLAAVTLAYHRRRTRPHRRLAQ